MNTSGHLQILCALLLAFQGVFCNEFDQRKYRRSINANDEVSSGDFFKFLWRNSKQRRSVGYGQPKSADLEQIPQDKPRFECGDLVLAVILKHPDINNMFIYGLRGDLLHLGLLAASCGVSIKTTDKDVRLLFKRDSCYVKNLATRHVLSMNWYGTDMELSCPVSVTPPSVTCKGNAMEVTVGDGTADELFVALNEKEAPLLYVATQCWHRELSKQGELTFSVPYTSCGVGFRDGHFIVDLRSKDKLMPLSCPYKQVPAFPVTDSELPVKSVHDKPASVFPSTILASQTEKQEHAFAVKQHGHKTAGTPFVQPRAYWLPKLPSLPGSFNLSVNFPFSVPMAKPLEHHREHWMSKHVVSTPEPTPEPTTTSTVSSFTEKFETSDENKPSQTDSNGDYEQAGQEPVPVTESPPSQYHYRHHPYFFQKPTLTSSQAEASPDYQYQIPLPNTPLYPQAEWAQNYNVPRHNAHNVNHVLASLARYLPPGYFICPIQNHQSSALPQMFQSAVSHPAQPLQNPNYQKPDITPYGPLNPAVPPVKGFSEQPLASPEAFSPHHHHHHHQHHSRTPLSQPTQHFQPSRYQPYVYQSSSSRLGPATTTSSPSFIPMNLQFQTRPLSPSNPFQDARPFQSQYYQRPSQPTGLVQQPWSVDLHGQSRQSSRPIPEYLRYQAGGQQSLVLDQRAVVQTPGTGISSQPQYQLSQFSRFPHHRLRPEVISSYVSAENSDSSTKGFFQPRSLAQVPSGSSGGTRPAKSMLHSFFGQQGAQLPYRQGPSI